MVLEFSESYANELNEIFSSRRMVAIGLLVAYIRGVLESLLVLILLHVDNQLDDRYFNGYIVNLLFSYVSVSLMFNAAVSTLCMLCANSVQVESPVAYLISGVKKLQYFHPYSIFRNIITRPLMVSVMYTLVIIMTISTYTPHLADSTVNGLFILLSCGLSFSINAVTGVLKTLWLVYIGKNVLTTKSVLFDNPRATSTMDVPQEESPQEYEPPKLDSYFTISV